MIMRCIAVDDEPLALAQMSRYIDRTAFLDLAGAFRTAREASAWLGGNSVDIVFADIDMPGMNGLDFVRSLEKKPLVVFATAYDEYALEGFRVDAIDYLLKPVGYDDFLRSAEKAYRQFQLLGGDVRPLEERRTIFVKADYKVIPIDISDILHIESRSEYVRIFTDGGRPLMSLGSLKSYEEKLPAEMFMRVHRSYIVNLRRIRSFGRRTILMADGASIPVGDSFEERFREYIAGRL